MKLRYTLNTKKVNINKVYHKRKKPVSKDLAHRAVKANEYFNKKFGG